MRTPANKRFIQISLAILFVLTVASIIVTIMMNSAKSRDVESLTGCYVYEENIYRNPLSSFIPGKTLPYVYGFDEDVFIIANTAGGPVECFDIEYMEVRVDADEFTSLSGSAPGTLFLLPDLTGIRDRYLLAEMKNGEDDYGYRLYSVSGDLWLVSVQHYGVQTIYKLKESDTASLDDLYRVIAFYESYAPVPLEPTTPGSGHHFRYENQMTLKDVYALARRGDKLSVSNFSLFPYWLAGDDFTARLFEVVEGENLLVSEHEGNLVSAMLISRRTSDSSQAVDMREGFEAVSEYLSPLRSFMDITIEYEPGTMQERELLFADDYFGSECNYYLNAGGTDKAFVVFNDSDERMLVRDALQARRLTIEDAVANGLFGVSMIPFENQLGGEFPILVHSGYTFMLGEDAFYPSKSFMYTVTGISITAYFDFEELITLLGLYGHDETAESLRQRVDPANLFSIAGREYIHEITLAGAGIKLNTGWTSSRHIPVQFTFSD